MVVYLKTFVIIVEFLLWIYACCFLINGHGVMYVGLEGQAGRLTDCLLARLFFVFVFAFAI